MKKQRFLLVVGLLLGCWMALSVGLTLAGQFAQPPNVQSGWTAVFTETFTNTLSMWTFTETTSTGYQWGVVPYSRTVDNELVNDYGLWASGGGSAGENLVWPTDTYTTGMDTRAVVGPISLTKEIIEASLNFHVYNNIDQDDVFSVAFSLDGISFVDVITVTTAPTSWEQLNWNSSAVRGATELWIVFSFTSDNASEPHLGPLVDDVVLEVRSGGTVYLPLVRQDPTPTPTLTPTPLPVYVDHFIDPNSGWYDGPAMRLNCRKDNVGDCTWVWEEVATMRYLSGEYQMYIPLTAHGGGLVDTWFVRAAEFAPLPEAMYPLPQNYCVESRAIFANAQNNGEPYIAHWGLVFGGDALKTDIYTFQINSLGKYHVIRYNNYVYPGIMVDLQIQK